MEFTSLSDALIGLIPIYGPWIIFGIVAFESAGVPLPGETILVAAALLAATTGQINIVVVVVRWRLIDLSQWIYEEFRITVAKQTLSRELRAMGYRKLSARIVPSSSCCLPL